MWPQDTVHGRYFQRLHLGSVGCRVISTRLLYPNLAIGPTWEGRIQSGFFLPRLANGPNLLGPDEKFIVH